MSAPTEGVSSSPASATKAVASAEVRHVIVRACVVCSGPRVIDVPCGQCGNPNPPHVVDLGVVTAIYRNPLRRVAWRLARKPLADLRIRRANQRAIQLRADRE